MSRARAWLHTLLPAAPLVLFAAFNGLTSTAFLEADDVAHYEYSRFAPRHPEAILEVWGRPLVTLFYLLPAQGGPQVARMASLVLGLLASAAAAALARRAGLKTPALAAVAVWAMPYVFVQTYAIMTELLFSTLLAAGVICWRDRRFAAAIAMLTWTPLARPEGFFVGIFFGFATLFDRALTADFGRRFSLRRCGAALGLAAGTAVWWLAGLPHYRSVDWLLERWPKNWGAESPYGEGRPHPFYFLSFLGLVVTAPLLPAFVLGVRRLWQARFRLEIALVAYFVVLHGVLWTFRVFGSAGYPRYLVTAAPLLALLIAAGFDGPLASFAARGRAATDPEAEERLRARRATIATWLGAAAAAAAVALWPNARPYHGDVDVKTLNAAAAWFVRAYPDPAARPFVIVDHPAFRPPADVDADGRSSRFEPLALEFAPLGSVAVWETKFAARYSKVSRADLARLGFEETPRREVAGDPPYAWDGPPPKSRDPELEGYDWGVFVRRTFGEKR
jgi:4-amino-4-deoxy-L-arabinose transferase-like glycosyltransferase